MVQTEVIAVNDSQKRRLRAAAQSRVAYWRKRGRPVKLDTYFKPLPHKVARNFKTGCGRTPHSVVRVACGLRKQANINHRSKLRIKYRGHKRGIACYMKLMDRADRQAASLSDQPHRSVAHHDYERAVRAAETQLVNQRARYKGCVQTCDDNNENFKHTYCDRWVKNYNLIEDDNLRRKLLQDFPKECSGQ